MKYIKWTFWILATALVAFVGYSFFCWWKDIKKPVDMELGFQKEINQTPAILRSIERLGQWEFLSIDDEVLVDTTETHFFSPDDHLVRIYHGTLRLGIDFSQCERGWATISNDTATLRLPPIQLLDRNFIDEGRTRSFYEQGDWDAQTKEDMYQRARSMMIQRAMTSENIKQAEENARHQVEALFRSLGCKVVRITVERSS
jgi:hypothetical protein